MRKPIQEQWNQYLAMVMPAGASPVQLQETRRAFYAGCAAMNKIVMKGLTDDAEVTAEDEAYMAALFAELAEFSSQVGAGKA